MLVYFMDILSILRPFDIFYGHLIDCDNLAYLPPFWYILPRKIWQPCRPPQPTATELEVGDVNKMTGCYFYGRVDVLTFGDLEVGLVIPQFDQGCQIF
jgi:hypothetical protein